MLTDEELTRGRVKVSEADIDEELARIRRRIAETERELASLPPDAIQPRAILSAMLKRFRDSEANVLFYHRR